MLPALIARPRAFPPRRMLVLLGSAFFGLAAISLQFTGAPQPPAAVGLADELRPSTWAMQVPSAWLAAPVPHVRKGDVLDILAVHGGDRAFTVPVAYAVSVLASDERGLVLEVDANDASAIATARGSGLMLVPLLRSTR